MSVSVIIPIYNAANFIESCILSAYSNELIDEIIIVEDYSTDNSYEICEKLAFKYSKLKLLRTPAGKNSGASVARNFGLKNSKNDWIAFLDADDKYLQKLTQTFSLESKVDAYFFYSSIKTKGREKITRGYFSYEQDELIPDKKIKIKQEIDYSLLDFLKGVSPSIFAIVFHKRVLSEIGYFDPMLRQCQDTDWMLRLFWKCRVQFSGNYNPIVEYNIHGKNRVLQLSEMLKFNSKFNLKWILISLFHKMPIEVLLIFIKRYIGIHRLNYYYTKIPKRIRQVVIVLGLPFSLALFLLKHYKEIFSINIKPFN